MPSYFSFDLITGDLKREIMMNLFSFLRTGAESIWIHFNRHSEMKIDVTLPYWSEIQFGSMQKADLWVHAESSGSLTYIVSLKKNIPEFLEMKRYCHMIHWFLVEYYTCALNMTDVFAANFMSFTDWSRLLNLASYDHFIRWSGET